MNDFLTSKESTLKKFEKIEIHFDGIFQNRLATDPDSFDNPIGDLGWTRSHTGEPNFDRIIRFLPFILLPHDKLNYHFEKVPIFSFSSDL
ncbi:MAG TPA: hypothetical protein VE244_00680 [Nitrososphaeraceae archaeon]|jgi:hypothetical protein|nr:hypothetical protein [Nitrososphaeraceae archaeon]